MSRFILNGVGAGDFVGRCNCSASTVLRVLAVLLLAFVPLRASGDTSVINYVQGNYSTPQSPQSTVSVAFGSAQSAGDLNVVVVGWNDTNATVQSVTDTHGNTYLRAVGPTLVSGVLSQSTYYAANISPGSNTVTVVFSAPANSPDVRIEEYAGANAQTPVDVTAAQTGNGGTTTSGVVTTTNPNDLIVGANIVTGITSGPGTGFTKRILTTPDGDITEDEMVSATGNYSASAPATGNWIMQMVAFRAVATVSGTSPAITSASAATFSTGTSGTFTAIATGTPTPAFAESGTLPTGVSFHDNGNGTATLSGTPSTGAAGTYQLTITANNGVGSPASQSFTLTVQSSQSAAIAFVQVNSATPQSPQTSVSVRYSSAQTAGDINVVIVGWNDSTAQISSVADSAGNHYILGVGPTVQSGAATQAIYYAANIAASASNTVSVTFNTAAASPDIRIAEYSGISATSPVDSSSAAQGSGSLSNSGSASSANANDLLIGANLVQQITQSTGAGFTSRVITSPDADILEDSVVTAAGSYSATANLSGGQWIMQMVAFRAATGASGTAPAITSASSATFSTGTAGTFTVTTSGTPAPSLTQTGALPAGVIFQNNQNGTATLSGTPSSGSAGTYTLTLTANNGIGSSATQNFVLTVNSSDTQAPTAPTNLTATGASGSQINVSWTASSDNVGVTGYVIERCAGASCTNFAALATVTVTSYSDAGLTLNTSYTYEVKAMDAAGNSSAFSNTATASTLASLPGLVAAYSFNEGSGTTVADLSGNGNSGTLTNAAWTTSGKYGNALVFNGSSSLVTIQDSASLHLTTAMTLEAWVDPSSVTNEWTDVIYKGNDNYFLEGTSSRTVPGGGGTFGSANVSAYGTAALPIGVWTHLALTYDGATLRLYVNGTQVSSAAQTGNILISSNPLQIGGDSFFGQYFSGVIDEVRVYDVALNQSQIQADMVAPVSSLPTYPAVGVGSSSITFASQTEGTTSAAQLITVTNTGNSQLSIGSIAVSGGNAADFAQTNNCGSTLQQGNSCTINVNFTPEATGPLSSAILITDNAANSPQTISLNGTGAGFSISISPRAVALTPYVSQQFTSNGNGVTWSVDGIVGGSTASGSITAAGMYTPPTTAGAHIVTAATAAGSANATVYVSNYPGTFTFHNDNQRSGQNTSETVLNLSNVNQTQFGKLFSYPIDGLAFASPLYVANVSIPGQGIHNVVYLATENDSVYAFDADGRSSTPLWHVSFLSTGVTTVPCSDTGECGDIPQQIGISGTPVIDPSSGTLYVVANTEEGSTYVQRLHALNIATGAEKFGGPIVIQATVAGSGSGSVNNQLAFDPLHENQRAALLLSNGVVYISWSAHGDQLPWHGWIMGYNATTLQQTMAECISPNGYGAGIWMSNGGPAVDASGDIYFTTGNGDFTANTGGADYGDTIMKLSPSGTVLDYFTPHDQSSMEANDLDLSSAGPALLLDQPGAIPHLLIASGKTGTVYVVNRDNMGKFNPNNDNQIVQTLPSLLPNGTEDEGNYSAPAFFNENIYFGAVNDNLKAFPFSGGLLASVPGSESPEIFPNRGASFAVSANGSTNGILWAVQDNAPSNGLLYAYDATNLAHELYNSAQAGSRDTLGIATKFSIPLVANGKVFVVANGALVVYGLLP